MPDARLYFIHALSPLHAGAGQGIGAIDLPIARERATNLPFLPGSSVKGVLRDRCKADAACKASTASVFGPETENASDHAGSVVVADARLLLLPVRSMAGTYAWVTSPYLLRRARRDAREVQGAAGLPAITGAPSFTGTDAGCWLPGGSVNKFQAGGRWTVYLEELDLTPEEGGNADAWAQWLGSAVFPADEAMQQELARRLCIVHDDVLGYLLNTATEITARIRLNPDTKTTDSGALWYEEALPAETVLMGMVLPMSIVPPTGARATPDVVYKTLASLTRTSLQFGGKATVGRGVCTLHLSPPWAEGK